MVDRSVKVTLRADVNPFVRAMAEAEAAAKGLDSQINKTNDRTAWLAQGLLALAPAVVPLGAAAIPVLSGIATQATVTAGAVGTLFLALKGVGAGLKALETFKQAPTAENFQKLQTALAKLGPDGEHFVRFLEDVKVQLSGLQMVARAGMFPGMEAGINSVLTRLPMLRNIVQEIATGIGRLVREGGANLAGPSWDRFFQFLEHDAQPILMDMGRTVGNLAHGFADLLVAFAPLSMRFSSGLLNMSRSFATWAAGVDKTQGFQNFLAYVEDAGPKALDFLGAIAHFGIELAHAYAPIGATMLPVLTHLLNLFADLADTPVGHLVLVAATLTSVYGRIRAIGELTGSGASKILFGGSLGGGLKAMSSDLESVKKSAADAKASVVSWKTTAVAAEEQVAAASKVRFDAQKAASRASSYEATAIAKYEGAQARLAATTIAAAEAQDKLNIAQRGGPGFLSIGQLADQQAVSMKALAAAERQVAESTVAMEAAQRGAIRTQASLSAAVDAETIAEIKLASSQFAATPTSRFLAGWQGASSSVAAFGKQAGSAALKIAPLGLALSPLPEKLGMTNTAMGAMVGSAIGPWGTAIGAAAGFVTDLVHANGEFVNSLHDIDAAIAAGASGPQLQDLYRQKLAEAQQYKDAIDQVHNYTQHGSILGAGASWLLHPHNSMLSIGNDISELFGDSQVTKHQQELDAYRTKINQTIADQERLAKVRAWREIKAHNAEMADSFVNLGSAMKKPTLSLDDLIKRWRTWAKAEASQGQNIQTLIGRGADPKAIQQIVSQLGPEAGLALQQMVARGSKGVKQLNDLYTGLVTHAASSMRKANNDIAEAMQFGAPVRQITALQKKFDNLTRPQKAKIEAVGIPQTMADVKKVADALGLTAKDWPVLMSLFDHASPGVKNLKQLLDSINKNPVINITQNTWRHVYDVPSKGSKGSKQYDSSLSGITNYPRKATGGLLRGPGTGTSDSIPLWGSNGEFMMRAAAVQKYGLRFMEDANALRLAKGGLVTQRAFEYQRPTAGGARLRASVHVGDLSVTGTLQTPWGPAEVAGIARAVAEDVVDQHDAFENRRG